MKQKWKIGKVYKIGEIKTGFDQKIVRRLLEFGFTPGTKFMISYKSLLAKSVIVELRGFSLSIRTRFLDCLEVESER